MTTLSDISFDNTRIAFAGKSDKGLKRAFHLFRIMNNGSIVSIGSKLTNLAFKLGLPIDGLIKYSIYEQFCGGEDLQETIRTTDKLAKHNLKAILDFGVEAKEEEADFEKVIEEQIKAINFANGRPDVPCISCKVTGLITDDLLRKINDLLNLNPEDKNSADRVRSRMRKACEYASQSDVAVYYDAEESWIQDGIDLLVTELMAEYNKEKAVVFSTIQLYRHDRLDYLKRSYEEAVKGDYFLALKLVRGAYMDKERERAQRKGYTDPIHKNKDDVDRDFNLAIEFCLDHIERIAFCVATHNEESCKHLIREMKKRNIRNDHPHVHVSQLYGMSDHISYNLADAGYFVSKYLPYGPVKEVIPYLIRRAEENTSVEGQMSRELALLQKEVERRKLNHNG